MSPPPQLISSSSNLIKKSKALYFYWRGLPLVVFVQKKRVSLKLLAPLGENHLELRSPSHMLEEHWEEFLQQHQDWIKKHYQPLFSNHFVRLWGQYYSLQLKIDQASGYEKKGDHILFFWREPNESTALSAGWPFVELASVKQEVFKPQSSLERVNPLTHSLALNGLKSLRRQVQLCYLNELRHWLPTRVLFWLHTLKVSATQIRIVFMRSLWGSCHIQRRVLTFNGYLAAYPKHFVDSVILHECAHLLIPDHGPKFRSLLKEHQSKLWPTHG